jgi:triosephosphate isomerase
VNLASAVDHLEFTTIDVAAQNVHEGGAFTGEISEYVKSVGVEHRDFRTFRTQSDF